jgi:hypothetical protein
MHVPINVKSSNNISKWQMGFNSAFKGLIRKSVKDFVYYKAYFLLLSENSALLFDVEEKASSFCLKVSYLKTHIARK